MWWLSKDTQENTRWVYLASEKSLRHGSFR